MGRPVRKNAERELIKTAFRSALCEWHALGPGAQLHIPSKLVLKGKLVKVE
jgi:hypothetical protein